MTLLSVNLNKVALIRNSRDTTIPSVLDAARTCIKAGSSGITVHPRPDMRHIRPSDVYSLSAMLKEEYPHIEFNIEGNPYAGPEQEYPGFLDLVRAVQPAQCTLVPDDPSQLTSDHGWNLTAESGRLQPIIHELQSLGIRVSAFMEPDLAQIRLAGQIGIDRIELYTGPYAEAYATNEQEEVFAGFMKAAREAQEIGIGLNAGHDLNLDNLAHFCQVPDLSEVSIGHAIISDAIWMGLEQVVAAYRAILDKAGKQEQD
jgi:pyridoxine 5-phosphate synthase